MNNVYRVLLPLNLTLLCQGSLFLNLDFQSPNVNAITGVEVQVRDAIPGWQLQTGNYPVHAMLYNNICLSCPSASLGGPTHPSRGDIFTFVMKSGITSSGFLAESIYQTGDVPADTRSLQFVAAISPNIDSLHVSLGGQQLPLIQFEMAGPFFEYRYEADVSAWSGKTAELRFTVGPGTFPDGAGGILANIHFSPDALPATPEPSTWALLCTGLAAFIWNARRCRNRPIT